MCRGKLLAPLVKQFNPVIEAFFPIVGTSNFIVVNMIKCQFHYIAGKPIIPRQRRNSLAISDDSGTRWSVSRVVTYFRN